jgi:hypothetical protein
VNTLELMLFKYKHPTSELTSKLIVGHQPLNRLVVNIQSELSAIKIGPEMYDSPYDIKTLPLV